MKFLIGILFSAILVGPSLYFYKNNFEWNDMTYDEIKCIKHCERKMKSAIIVDFLEPTKCFCGSWLDAQKKIWPKQYRRKYGKRVQK